MLVRWYGLWYHLFNHWYKLWMWTLVVVTLHCTNCLTTVTPLVCNHGNHIALQKSISFVVALFPADQSKWKALAVGCWMTSTSSVLSAGLQKCGCHGDGSIACYLKCKHSFKLCWCQLEGGSESEGVRECVKEGVGVRVRKWWSESGREREIRPKNHQRFPQNSETRNWTKDKGNRWQGYL